MWWPIRNQILVPFAAILLIGVAVTAASAAYLAARRSERTTTERLNRVIATLGKSNFPYSENVLLRMRGLSGAEFAVFDRVSGQQLAATLPQQQTGALPEIEHSGGPLESLASRPAVELDGRRYYAASLERIDPMGRPRMLLVLYPEASWKQSRWEAAGPPLIVGAVTFVLMVFVSAWLADRMGWRIRSVQRQVAGIATGDFNEVVVRGRNDEIQELGRSVNHMSRQLRQMRQTIAQTERARLLGQFAGGLAHQLRNAITGARLAVQIHHRRCDAPADDDSLDVALRQLTLTEEQVRGLLSLGRTERRPPVACSLSALMDEVAALVQPVCRHGGVDFNCSTASSGEQTVTDSEPVRTALLNLAINAIEAAGAGGSVYLTATVAEGEIHFDVTDTGPGPPAELVETLFDPFVSGKPEGTGLGLALARQVAETQGGSLRWNRIENQTRFRLTISGANSGLPSDERPRAIVEHTHSNTLDTADKETEPNVRVVTDPPSIIHPSP